MAARKIVCADPSLRHTSMLLGQTNQDSCSSSSSSFSIFPFLFVFFSSPFLFFLLLFLIHKVKQQLRGMKRSKPLRRQCDAEEVLTTLHPHPAPSPSTHPRVSTGKMMMSAKRHIIGGCRQFSRSSRGAQLPFIIQSGPHNARASAVYRVTPALPEFPYSPLEMNDFLAD